MFFILCGCSSKPEDGYRGDNNFILVEKQFDLQHRTEFLTLHFQDDHMILEDQQVLKTYLLPRGLGKSSVHVSVPEGIQRAMEKRFLSLKDFLSGFGVTESRLHFRKDLKHSRHSVLIRLDTYQAIPIACFNQAGIPEDHFGCATANNLLLMLEDPASLFKGTLVDRVDSAREAVALSKYRKGEPQQSSASTVGSKEVTALQSAVGNVAKSGY